MTKTKWALSVLLLLFLAGAAFTVLKTFKEREFAAPMRETQEETAAPARETVSANQAVFDLSSFKENKILAVYFHGTIRCKTCLEIEKMARDVVTSGFSDKAGAGGIFWTAINYDVPENDRYAVEFQIELPSLILMEVEDGKALRWKNLRNTWDLIDDGQSFSKYVFDETVDFINQ